MVVVAVHGRGLPKIIFEQPLAIWLGKRSYSFYLWHLPIVRLLAMMHLPTLALIVIGLPLSLLAAELSFRFIETPFLRMKHGFAAKPAPHVRTGDSGIHAEASQSGPP
jgi:peptidoglycan/LPS O-acetylase OafA/YrhL